MSFTRRLQNGKSGFNRVLVETPLPGPALSCTAASYASLGTTL